MSKRSEKRGSPQGESAQNVRDVTAIMKKKVYSVHQSDTLGEAVRVMLDNHVGLLPVVDDDHMLVGVLSLRDVLRLSWPAFVTMLEDYDFVHDFGALEESEISPDLRRTPVIELMNEATKVEGSCKLLRAAAVMRQHGIYDLPIVDEEGRLIGLASWVDVGTAFLDHWTQD